MKELLLLLACILQLLGITGLLHADNLQCQSTSRQSKGKSPHCDCNDKEDMSATAGVTIWFTSW